MRALALDHRRSGRGNEFPLTHEFLAVLLGSRHSGITVAFEILQKAGFIHYSRGVVAIVDREGLEATACEGYKITTAQFGDLLSLAPSLTIRPTQAHVHRAVATVRRITQP